MSEHVWVVDVGVRLGPRLRKRFANKEKVLFQVRLEPGYHHLYCNECDVPYSPELEGQECPGLFPEEET